MQSPNPEKKRYLGKTQALGMLATDERKIAGGKATRPK